MIRLFTLVICIISVQIVKADGLFTAPPTNSIKQAKSTNTITNTFGDTTTLGVITNRNVAIPYQYLPYKRRLDSLTKDVQLDYNEYVQSYIDIYTRHKDEMAAVIGLTKYYFPIYEKAFRDAGIPEEIKYLSIVESKLDPNAVSRVGATGPWQFMPTTAKLYGLNMDDYVDDRRDPIQASYAAAAYLKDAYQEFGDWLLAIASYNCGKSNIERAIEKAGANDFWSIRQYLPVETRGYVPAYIAVAYVMNCYNKHSIVPQACNFSMRTDTVLVNKFVSLDNISRVLDISVRELSLLNPAYKQRIINGTANAPRRLIIPQTAKENYAALYEALNSNKTGVWMPAKPPVIFAATTTTSTRPLRLPVYHTVKRGETIAGIADKYGVEVQDLKDWNHLHGKKATVGQRLKLSEKDDSENTSPVKRGAGYSLQPATAQNINRG